MIILTNSLSDTPDEGARKVATNLVARLREETSGVKVVTYDRSSSLSDQHLKLNKLMLSPVLFRLLRRSNDPLLYIPFPTRSLPMAARTFLLSRLCRGKFRVLLSMTAPVGSLAGFLLRHSRGEIMVVSRPAWDNFRAFLPEDRLIRVKIGVDTDRFCPATAEQAKQLKKKYGFDPARPVVLHVGHLKSGRNVADLTKLPGECQSLLVVSTHTEQETALRQELLRSENIRILDAYIPDIQAVYRLSDVYLFPVEQPGNCIDVPLSCLEAAACGKPVVTTTFGEMKEFAGRPGFFFLKSREERDLAEAIEAALNSQPGLSRNAVTDYDWHRTAALLQEWGKDA